MEPLTTGLGLTMGVANVALSAGQASREKSLKKKSAKLDSEMALQNRKRALEELAFKERDIKHQDVFDERNINEGMNAKDVLDSSMTGDAQAEREYQLANKLDAMNRSRGDIDFEYQMMLRKKKIGDKLADSSNWMNMLQTAINGGAMAMGQFAG